MGPYALSGLLSERTLGSLNAISTTLISFLPSNYFYHLIPTPIMSSHEDSSDKDVLNRSFIDPVFLQEFPLTIENALEYFCRSPFYDLHSNNEVILLPLIPRHLSN